MSVVNSKWRVVFFMIISLLFIAVLALKINSSLLAKPLKMYSSDSGKCYISRYAPDYEVLGVLGGIFELFSSPYFYRVYSVDSNLLRTSEWYLWVREGNSGIAPEFQGEIVFYPGSDGWKSWRIPECR